MTDPDPIAQVDLDLAAIDDAMLAADPCADCVADLGAVFHDDNTVSLVITHSASCTALGEWLRDLVANRPTDGADQ